MGLTPALCACGLPRANLYEAFAPSGNYLAVCELDQLHNRLRLQMEIVSLLYLFVFAFWDSSQGFWVAQQFELRHLVCGHPWGWFPPS